MFLSIMNTLIDMIHHRDLILHVALFFFLFILNRVAVFREILRLHLPFLLALLRLSVRSNLYILILHRFQTVIIEEVLPIYVIVRSPFQKFLIGFLRLYDILMNHFLLNQLFVG